MKQSLKQYVDNYSGAPLLVEEFAQAALEVKPTAKSAELIATAKTYLEAQEAFFQALKNVNVEIG